MHFFALFYLRRIKALDRKDFLISNSSSNGHISYVSAFTNNARENNEFEIHTHYDRLEIYYFLEGDLFFAFDGKRYDIKDRTMIIIPEGMLHRPVIKHPCPYFRKRILFSKEIFGGYDFDKLDFSILLKKAKIIILDSQTISDMQLDVAFDNVADYLSLHSEYGDFCATVALCSLLIKTAQIDVNLAANSFELHNDKILQIIKYIDANLNNKLNYKDLSNHFFISEKGLYKFFKKETGFALGAYINERRVMQAQNLLLSGISSKEAAIEAGFQEYTSFYRSFLKRTGCTPSQYVKLHKRQ